MAETDLKKNLEESKVGLPSNDRIVDSLLTDVEQIHLNDEESKEKDSCCKSSETNSDSHIAGNSPLNSESDDVTRTPYFGNREEETKCDDTDEDDFVDEEHLKDLEIDYTEEDRKKFKDEAENLKTCGNDKFKSGEYKEAALTYTKALRICPLAYSKNRAVLYSNRAAAKLKLNFSESAIEDCTKAVELDPQYLKAYLRRAQLYEQSEKLDEAFADYKKILEIDPSHKEAIFACQRLPDQINERNEKLKTEMLGKLKDLGNMILKPFGLSTNNFQMVKDPNSDGYSVNFSQNPTNHS